MIDKRDYSALSLKELREIYESHHLYRAQVQTAIEDEVMARVRRGDMPTADLARLHWARDPNGACRETINAAIMRHAARANITAKELADLCEACLCYDGPTYAAVDDAIVRRVRWPGITEDDLTALWFAVPDGTPGRRAVDAAIARLEDDQEKT